MATPNTASKTTAAATKTEKPKTRLERMNVRALYLQRLAEGFRDEIAAFVETESEGKTKTVLEELVANLKTVCEAAAVAPKKLFRLNELKWAPVGSRVASPFKAGIVVALKPNRVDRFTKNGAYEAKALSSLTVASLHGDQAKIQITGTKEPLGLVPTSWLTVKAA